MFGICLKGILRNLWNVFTLVFNLDKFGIILIVFGDFFDFYDLPIVDVLLRLGGNERLVTIRLFFEPAEKEFSNPKN